MSEWLKETGCKPVGIAYSGSNPLAPTICGSSSAGRASAFQAEGREFESRLPLYYYYYYYFIIICPCGSVVEHTLGKGEVTGSNPVMGFCFSILFIIGKKTMIS